MTNLYEIQFVVTRTLLAETPEEAVKNLGIIGNKKIKIKDIIVDQIEIPGL